MEKDFSDLHVAKFDCSVYRPICEGIGIVDYPSLVWMKKGQLVNVYKGQYDIESLKTYVFEKMQSIKFSAEVATQNALISSESMSSESSTKIVVIKPTSTTPKTTSSRKSQAQSLKPTINYVSTKKQVESSSEYYSSEETKKPGEKTESDEKESSDESEDESEQKINLLGLQQESSESSNSTEMEEILSLEDSEDSADSESASLTSDLPRVVKVVKSSNSKAYFVELSAANFTKNMNRSGVTLIMMYAPWSLYCDEMRKKLRRVALKHEKNSLITIGEIDCVNNVENEKLCLAEKMKGIPTLNVYRSGKLLINDYKGRTFEELNDCIVSHLTDKGVEKWKQRDRLRKDEKI